MSRLSPARRVASALAKIRTGTRLVREGEKALRDALRVVGKARTGTGPGVGEGVPSSAPEERHG